VRTYFEKKNPSQKKRASGVAQGVGPEFKPQYQKKNNERWAAVAQALKSSLLRGRYQEDHSLKAAPGI
jgi:hypothetical protein